MTNTLPELRFDSKPENIAVVERLIDKLSEQHSIIPEHYGNVLIAMTEGVNNAIVHGNKLDPDKSVTVVCAVDEKSLVFRSCLIRVVFALAAAAFAAKPRPTARPNC